jgi:hypothetical protein
VRGGRRWLARVDRKKAALRSGFFVADGFVADALI